MGLWAHMISELMRFAELLPKKGVVIRCCQSSRFWRSAGSKMREIHSGPPCATATTAYLSAGGHTWMRGKQSAVCPAQVS